MVDREEGPGSPVPCGTHQRESSAGVCAGVNQHDCLGTAQADSTLQTPPFSLHELGGSHRVESFVAHPVDSQT